MGCRYLWVSKPWSSEVSRKLAVCFLGCRKTIWLPNHLNPWDFSEVADTSCGNFLWKQRKKGKSAKFKSTHLTLTGFHLWSHTSHSRQFELVLFPRKLSTFSCCIWTVEGSCLSADESHNHPTSQHTEEPQHHVPRSSGGRCRWIPLAKSSVMCWGSSFSNRLRTNLFSAL